MDIETITSCTKCNLFFMSQAEFAAHKKLRACSRKFTCHSCGKMYTNVKLLVSHLVETKHGETVCSVCNFAVESQDDMNAHIQRHALDLSKVSRFGILRLKEILSNLSTIDTFDTLFLAIFLSWVRFSIFHKKKMGSASAKTFD